MADVELSYKGAIIGNMSASGSLTLETAGKYCEDDIEVTYTSPGGGTSDFEIHPVTITSTSNVSINAPFLSIYPPDTLGGQHYISRNTPTTINFVFYKGRCYTGIDDMWILSGAAAFDDEYFEWYFTGEGSVSMELD